MNNVQAVVLGAGPAGLAVAARLARRPPFQVTVVERGRTVGGNAGSFDIDGMAVDFGSHRLHPSCAPHILADISRMLGGDLLDRPRHGRIRLRGRWLHFPLRPVDLARRLPPSFVAGIARDAVFRRASGSGVETFGTVLERGLGRTICREFYFPYARKIWGRDPEELDGEQARRRVSAGSVGKMVRKVLNAVPGMRPAGAGRFFYPRGGFGRISEAFRRAAVDAGVRLELGATVCGVEVEEGTATAVRVQADGGVRRIPADLVLSTIPLPLLARAVSGAVPVDVLEAAGSLEYRAMVLVYLVLETDRFTEYDAHYFPEPHIAITRLSEPKNYGLTGPPGVTVLCAELPCGPDDDVWTLDEADLERLVLGSLAAAGLPVGAPVRRVVVKRLRQAYPIYTREYRRCFDRLDEWIGGIRGLHTFGRQGLFVHDNTHHTLAMAYALEEAIDDRGVVDAARWRAARRGFEKHVVED